MMGVDGLIARAGGFDPRRAAQEAKAASQAAAGSGQQVQHAAEKSTPKKHSTSPVFSAILSQNWRNSRRLPGV